MIPIPLILVVLFIFFGVNTLASVSTHSGAETVFWFLPGFPVFIGACFWSSFAIGSALKKGRTRLKKIGVFLGICLFITFSVAGVRWYLLHPKNLFWEFEFGQSGSWHAVQFLSLEDGRVVEGPWVGGGPLQVSFPDLNADGHPDIRVQGRKRIAEFVYLPKPEGESRWHLVRSKGFQVSYPPDGQFYP